VVSKTILCDHKLAAKRISLKSSQTFGYISELRKESIILINFWDPHEDPDLDSHLTLETGEQWCETLEF
jgi:hypothetical protein